MIFVAGDMVDGTVVSQKNVLFDSDAITTRISAEPQQTVAAAQPVPETHDLTVDAEPVAGDSVAPARATAEQSELEPAPAAHTVPEMSLADNLLFNKATLETTGADTFVEMTEAFAATAERLAEGAETIAREVAQDALFAGMEALHVLQIDGDLVKLNLFEQTNTVGDADQIRLEMQALRDQFEADMELIAGSNALVNVATATEYGVDSKIMAGGDTYDAAFIHQAELFDVDAPPTGVAVSALTNEAIAAFLSGDMLKATEVSDEIVPTENYDASPQLDVMQSALA